MLRELFVEEVWQMQRDTPSRLIPPSPDMRPVRDVATNEVRFIKGELPKEPPCAG